MNARLLLPALLLCLPLAACDHAGTDPSNGKAVVDADSIGKKVRDATDKARDKLAQGNINVSDEHNNKAEITPQGDFLINGKPVTIDAQQRALLLDYRKQVERLAGAGMDIGVAGAQLGVKAAGEALRGVFSGNTEDIEKNVNAEAEKIEIQAKTLCNLLPEMMAKQQALAAALPAFKPYATMDQGDIDDCHA
jgi:hypothetical protein